MTEGIPVGCGSCWCGGEADDLARLLLVAEPGVLGARRRWVEDDGPRGWTPIACDSPACTSLARSSAARFCSGSSAWTVCVSASDQRRSRPRRPRTLTQVVEARELATAVAGERLLARVPTHVPGEVLLAAERLGARVEAMTGVDHVGLRLLDVVGRRGAVRGRADVTGRGRGGDRAGLRLRPAVRRGGLARRQQRDREHGRRGERGRGCDDGRLGRAATATRLGGGRGRPRRRVVVRCTVVLVGPSELGRRLLAILVRLLLARAVLVRAQLKVRVVGLLDGGHAGRSAHGGSTTGAARGCWLRLGAGAGDRRCRGLVVGAAGQGRKGWIEGVLGHSVSGLNLVCRRMRQCALERGWKPSVRQLCARACADTPIRA